MHVLDQTGEPAENNEQDPIVESLKAENKLLKQEIRKYKNGEKTEKREMKKNFVNCPICTRRISIDSQEKHADFCHNISICLENTPTDHCPKRRRTVF